MEDKMRFTTTVLYRGKTFVEAFETEDEAFDYIDTFDGGVEDYLVEEAGGSLDDYDDDPEVNESHQEWFNERLRRA